MKKIGMTLSAILFLFSVADSVSAVSEVLLQNVNYPIVVNGEMRTYEQSPVMYNDFTLIPLRGVFEDIGAEVKYDTTSKKITVIKGINSVTITVGSKTAFVNGKPVVFDISPQIINGRMLVPLRFVTESLGSQVTWDAKTKTISIDTGEKQPLENIMDNKESNKLNENQSIVGLTYQQALEKALATNLKLKETIANVEQSKENRDEAGDKLVYSPIGTGNGDSDAAARGALKGTRAAEISLEMSKKQINIMEDTIAYNVKTAYHAVIQKQSDKNLADLDVEHSLMEKNIVNIKAEQGLASDLEQTEAEKNYLISIENQKVADTSLKDAYLKLNQLIGLPIDARYALTDLPTFDTLEEDNLDYHVAKLLAESPSVWLQEKQVDLAQLDVDLYSFNSSGSASYKSKEIDVEKASLTLADSKKKLDESIRSIYNNIRQLENQYASLQTNLAKAEDNLKLLQTKFDLGMATSLEVFDAKLGIEQMKQQVLNITLKHDELKATYEKPWVM